MDDLSLYLSPAEYIDSDHPTVTAHAEAVTAGVSGPTEKARRLYLAVRDGVRYAPYVDYTNAETYRASSVLVAGQSYCVGKASLYAALCRAAGIPARIGLADVKNHLATPKLLEEVGTDVFAFHGYTELFLDGAWVKATPTFNETLCQKLGVTPLAFDGRADALLQAFDGEGRRFMAYLVARLLLRRAGEICDGGDGAALSPAVPAWRLEGPRHGGGGAGRAGGVRGWISLPLRGGRSVISRAGWDSAAGADGCGAGLTAGVRRDEHQHDQKDHLQERLHQGRTGHGQVLPASFASHHGSTV
jgi:transglutaminase-like putative cysteine protease